MKKPSTTEPRKINLEDFSEKSWEAKHPRIMEFLTDREYDDGSPRCVSALSVFWEDGFAKAAMNDKDLRRSLYVSANGVLEALKVLEQLLEAGEAPWRAWNGTTKKK